jgi:hypothetical protein
MNHKNLVSGYNLVKNKNNESMLTSGRRGLDHPTSVFGDPIAPLGFVGVHLFIAIEVIHKLKVNVATFIIYFSHCFPLSAINSGAI